MSSVRFQVTGSPCALAKLSCSREEDAWAVFRSPELPPCLLRSNIGRSGTCCLGCRETRGDPADASHRVPPPSRRSCAVKAGGGIEWFFSKPIAWVTGVVVLFGAILGIPVGAVALYRQWPQDWWPRQAPTPLQVTVAQGAQGDWVYTFPTSPGKLPQPPAVSGECGSRARHDWAMSEGGLPVRQEVAVTVAATPED